MPIRLRIPELLEDAGLSAYGLHKAAPQISLSTAYRLVAKRGALKSFPADTLEALADVLRVDVCDLFERTKPRTTAKKKRT